MPAADAAGPPPADGAAAVPVSSPGELPSLPPVPPSLAPKLSAAELQAKAEEEQKKQEALQKAREQAAWTAHKSDDGTVFSLCSFAIPFP